MEQNIICTACQKEIPNSAGMASGFCLHCGAPFSEGELPAKTTLTTPDADVAQLRRIYEGYKADAAELARTSGRKGIVQMLLGRDTFGDSPIHRAFYGDVESHVKQMATRMAALSSASPECGMAAGEAAELMLKGDMSEKSQLYWSIVAVEQYAAPLLPFVPLAQLRDLSARYAKRYPNHQALPTQRKLKEEMQRLIAEREKEAHS